MSNFGTTGIDTAEKTSRFLTYGINHCKIVGMSVIKAATTESKKVRFQMEGAPEGGSFEGVDGAKGKVGRVDTSYMSTDKAYKDFMYQIGVMADKLGVRKAVDETEAPTIEAYVAAIEPLLKGKFAWWLFGGEEYDAGKWKLSLPKYAFIKAEGEVNADTAKMEKYNIVEISNSAEKVMLKFDRTSRFHYLPLTKSEDGKAPSASVSQFGLKLLNTGTANIDNIPFGDVSNTPSKLPFDDEVNDLPFGN
jgi:hypothetical protein